MYRPHRFSYRHALREVGSAARDVYNTSNVAQSEDVVRLADEQTLRRYTLPGTAEWRVVADRSAHHDRYPVSRLFIPPGHDLGAQKVAVQPQQAATLGAWAGISGQDHGAINHYAQDGGLLALEFADAADVTDRYLALYSTPADAAASLGELQWTDTFQPTTGEMPRWEHPPAESNFVENIMQSGASYTAENGEPVRDFTVRHYGVGQADLVGYWQLFNAVGQVRPFWYEHSDSADYAALREGFSSTAGLSLTNCTAALVASSDGVSNHAVQLTATGSGVSCQKDFAAPIDFRGKRIAIDLRLNGGDVSGPSDVTLSLEDAAGGSVSWDIGGAWENITWTTWARVYVDAESPDTISATGLDLSAVDRWQINVAGTPAVPVQLDNLQTLDETKAPRLCRFARVPTREQDNPAPGSSLGPTYTITLEMREVIG